MNWLWLLRVFSAGEADQLRRAMAAWKKRGGLEVFERKLVDGMLARGHDRSFALRLFKQIQALVSTAFPSRMRPVLHCWFMFLLG